MSKKMVCLLVVCLLMVLIGSIGAYVSADGPYRDHARHIIHRTYLVLDDAQRFARRGHQYAGLGLAMGHQRYARDLFDNGRYQAAINHSLRARELAFDVIRNNGGEIRGEWGWDRTEGDYYHRMPRRDDLDLEIRGRSMDDRDAVRFRLDFSF
jgi:hypothetical protein